MDIVLEVADTFFCDSLYAWLLPAQPAPYDFPHTAANATAQPLSTWQYKPSTHLFTLEPPEAAYMSVWSRDNIARQFTSLFFITWYVIPTTLTRSIRSLTAMIPGSSVCSTTSSSPPSPTS